MLALKTLVMNLRLPDLLDWGGGGESGVVA